MKPISKWMAVLWLVGGCQNGVPVEGAAQSEAAAGRGVKGPASKPAPAPGADADEQEKEKWRHINGIETDRRHFIVRAGDPAKPVGTAMLTRREYHRGGVQRTGLEYWLFRRVKTDVARRAEYWLASHCSEYRDRRPIAAWGTGFWLDYGGKFRLRGLDGHIEVTGNRFREDVRDGRVKPPEGYRLLTELRHRMGQAIDKTGPAAFPWKRCLWREKELKWQTYSYMYKGPEKVTSAEGKTHAAHRFDVTPTGGVESPETVWVDEEIWPLRRVVPAMNRFEMLVTETDPGTDLKGALTWEEAMKAFGPKKAPLTTQPADIAF